MMGQVENKSKTPARLKDLWRTRAETLADLQHVSGYRVVLDVAASAGNAKAAHFITSKENSLKVNWLRRFELARADALHSSAHPLAAWMNPPFSKKYDFLQRAWEFGQLGLPVLGIIPYVPCATWFRQYVAERATFIFRPDGRINYDPPGGQASGKGDQNLFYSCGVLYSPARVSKAIEIDYTRGIGRE